MCAMCFAVFVHHTSCQFSVYVSEWFSFSCELFAVVSFCLMVQRRSSSSSCYCYGCCCFWLRNDNMLLFQSISHGMCSFVCKNLQRIKIAFQLNCLIVFETRDLQALHYTSRQCNISMVCIHFWCYFCSLSRCNLFAQFFPLSHSEMCVCVKKKLA